MPVSTHCDSCWWELNAHDVLYVDLWELCVLVLHTYVSDLCGFVGYWRPAVWCIWVCVAARWQQWTVNRFLPVGWAVISFSGWRGAKHPSSPENDTAKTSRCCAYHDPKTAPSKVKDVSEQRRGGWWRRNSFTINRSSVCSRLKLFLYCCTFNVIIEENVKKCGSALMTQWQTIMLISGEHVIPV